MGFAARFRDATKSGTECYIFVMFGCNIKFTDSLPVAYHRSSATWSDNFPSISGAGRLAHWCMKLAAAQLEFLQIEIRTNSTVC